MGGSGTDTVKVKEQDGVSDFYADLDTGFYYFKGVEASQDGLDTLLKDFEAVVIEGYVNSELIGGDAAETFTGGDGIDTISAGGGNDVIDAGAEADTISGGAGADTLTGGAGADIFTGFSSEDQSVVASAHTFADPIADTNTITFATGSAGSVDVITDFVSGTDKLDVTNADTAPTNLIGVASTGALVDGSGYILYGSYVETTGVFTAATGYDATNSNDALFVEGDGTETAITETDYVVLLDLNQALVSTDFI
jgi:Ca2+-binding RTX toxin-like protein